jgi:hypothetical protein
VEHAHSEHSHEEHGHGDEESVLVKKMSPNEMLAADLNEHGVLADTVAVGTHPVEKQEYYSHKFGLSSRFVTNRGVIRISGKNFDLVQVLERN